MTRGKARITCSATAKSTGRRCGKPPVPGATVCRLHGANAAVRRKGLRRLSEARMRAELEKWEKANAKREATRAAALAPWATEPIIRSDVERRYAEPADLRRIAREMRQTARELEAEAKQMDDQRRASNAETA